MIKLLGRIPNKICIAVSGGPDSMAALDFLYKNGKRSVLVLHFNHGTPHADKAESFVLNYCNKKDIPIVIGSLEESGKPKGKSQEEHWRDERYSFFDDYIATYKSNIKSYNIDYDSLTHFYYSNTKIITCHHLDDSVETWIFTSLHGNPMLIPHVRDNFFRPFLTTSKEELLDWCDKREVPYLNDESNLDTKYMRNLIRHDIMPIALKVNPGLKKVVYKKILKNFKWVE